MESIHLFSLSITTNTIANPNNPRALRLTPRRPIITASTSLRSPPSDRPRHRLKRLACEFRALEEPIERVKRLLDYAGGLPPLPEEEKIAGNRVAGCVARVWVSAMMDERGRMRFGADSDSEIARGMCGCLVVALDGAWPEEVMEVEAEEMAEVSVFVVGPKLKGRSRLNVWSNVLTSIKERTEEVVAKRQEGPFVSK